MSNRYSKKPRPLKEALKDFIDDYPHREALRRGMVLSLWPRVVGPSIQQQVRELHFENNRLIVHVADAAWRHELHMQRYQIAKKINDRIGNKVVDEIIVRS